MSGISENNVSTATLLNFLESRRTEADLSYSTVSTYRSTLTLPLELAKDIRTRGTIQDYLLKGVLEQNSK